MVRIDGGSIFEVGTDQMSVVNRWMLEGTARSNLDAINLTASDLPVWQEMGDMAAAGVISKELLKMPLVSANVSPQLPNFPSVQRYLIKEYTPDSQSGKNVRIGITGLLYDPEERISRTDFRIEDPQKAVSSVLSEMQGKTDYRIVLTDTDVGKAISMAVLVPGINLISVTHNYAAISEPQQVNDTLVVIPVNEGRILTEVRAAFELAANRAEVQARFVPLDHTVPDDPGMGELLRKAKMAIEDFKKGIR
jgi:2',3'-cyclic-nucleotide 2'-phosphodiesterase (5'-nucleotidase family)